MEDREREAKMRMELSEKRGVRRGRGESVGSVWEEKGVS